MIKKSPRPQLLKAIEDDVPRPAPRRPAAAPIVAPAPVQAAPAPAVAKAAPPPPDAIAAPPPPSTAFDRSQLIKQLPDDPFMKKFGVKKLGM